MKTIKNNQLYFDGCNTVDLAKKYGTPLFIISETAIVNKCNLIKEQFTDKYENTKAVYASKAFLTKAMCKIMEREGMGLDVVSGGELFTAISSNFPAKKIEFSGNNKLPMELSMAIDYGIGRINVDNEDELDLLITLCKEKAKKMAILFRITPGVSSNTHAYITTGHSASKFGIPMNDENMKRVLLKAIDSEWIDFKGFHFHVGSQLHDNSSHLQALEKTLGLIKKAKEWFDYDIEELDVGGGFGIRYSDADDAKPLSYFVDPIMARVKSFALSEGLMEPLIVIEPGRWVVGEAGLTLYTIGTTKDIPGIKRYISVDGGMTDNIRPALYQSKYEALLANKAGETHSDEVTVAGKCCESSDILIESIKLPKAEGGDVLAVFNTGAYGYSMANNYNKNVIPAVVLVKDGMDRLIVKRQSYEDMIANELVPESL